MSLRLASLVALMSGALAAGACTRWNSDERDRIQAIDAALTNYVTQTFNVRSLDDRAGLLSGLAGEAHERLAGWDEEEFRRMLIESKREFIRLQLLETRLAGATQGSVVYELSYFDRARSQDARVSVRRVAALRHEGDQWRIESVRQLRETIEFRSAQSVP